MANDAGGGGPEPMSMSLAANACCRQLAEKLEKSECGRKKLRQAISMLKEKLEATEKVLQVNDTLREEAERERRRADMEKKTAEEEKSARLMLEEDGKALKEQLAIALARINNLEACYATDKKEMQRLHDEVKVTVDGVRAAVKVTEAAHDSCRNLEKSLTVKVNKASSFAQNMQSSVLSVQDSSRAIQTTVASVQKDLVLLSSRVATLEKHGSHLGQRMSQSNQLQQQVPQTQEQIKSISKVSDAAASPRGVPKRPVVQNKVPWQNGTAANRIPIESNRKANGQVSERFTSSPTGVIEVIPGIRSILNPPTRPVNSRSHSSLRKEGGSLPVHGDVCKAIAALKNGDGSFEVGDRLKDVNVQDASRLPGSGSHVKLLKSINHLFQKEKRTRSKIEAKLLALEEAFSHQGVVGSSADPQANKRKMHDDFLLHESGEQKKAKRNGIFPLAENGRSNFEHETIKAASGRKSRKKKKKENRDKSAQIGIGNDNVADDSDNEIGDADLVQKWLAAREHLLSPSLPEIPPPVSKHSTTDRATGDPESISRTSSLNFLGVCSGCGVSSAVCEGCAAKPTGNVSTDSDSAANIAPGLGSYSNQELKCGDTDLACNTNDFQGGFPKENLVPVCEKQVRAVVLSKDSLDSRSVSGAMIAMENLKNCFVDSMGVMRASELWGLEFRTRFASITADNQLEIRLFILIFVSSLVYLVISLNPGSAYNNLHSSHGTLLQLAKFVNDVVLPEEMFAGKNVALDIMMKQISRFLIYGKTQSITFSSKREDRGVCSYSISASEATFDEVVVASKLLGALCEFSGKFQLIQTIACKILRWSQQDHIWMLTVFASFVSVSKGLLSESNDNLLSLAIRFVVSELSTVLDYRQNNLQLLPDTEGSLVLQSEDLKLLRDSILDLTAVSFEATLELLMKSVLGLLSSAETSSLSGFDLLKEMGLDGLNPNFFEENGNSWRMRFHNASVALELVSLHMGWEWTYNDLIVGQLWSLVAPGATQISVASVARLLGILGRLGVDRSGNEMIGVDELRKRLAVILQETGFSFSTRVVAAHALLELSLIDTKAPRLEDILENEDGRLEGLEVLHPEYVRIVQEWFQGLDAEEQIGVPLHLKNRNFACK